MDEIQQEAGQEIAAHELKTLCRDYFPKLKSPRLVFDKHIPGPACMADGAIYLNTAVAQWPKMRKLLMLHELIHCWLQQRDGNPDEAEGNRFQAEIIRLCKTGVYRRLL